MLLGRYGSSELATILLEVPFTAHQGQVSDQNIFNAYKKNE